MNQGSYALRADSSIQRILSIRLRARSGGLDRARHRVRREDRGPQAGPDPVVPAAGHVVLDAAAHQGQDLPVLGGDGEVGRLEVEQLRHLGGGGASRRRLLSRPPRRRVERQQDEETGKRTHARGTKQRMRREGTAILFCAAMYKLLGVERNGAKSGQDTTSTPMTWNRITNLGVYR